MQSVSDDDVRKRFLEKPRFELVAKGMFRQGRCYIFWCTSVKNSECQQGDLTFSPLWSVQPVKSGQHVIS